MDYGRYSDKYSGGYGHRQRSTKVARRELKAIAALEELRRRATLKSVYADAKAKAKGNLGHLLDEIKGFFRRSG
jgi:hypothetical protein